MDQVALTPTLGWTNMYNPGNMSWNSNAYYYEEGFGWPMLPPLPSGGGNYSCFWVNNISQNSNTYRGGIMNKLTSQISPNSGSYGLSFDVACLNDCGPDQDGGSGEAKIAIYGIYNPTDFIAPAPAESHIPSTPSIYGVSNTFLLGIVTLEEDCNRIKYSKSINFNSQILSRNITHIILTNSQNLLAAKRFIAVDNFCLRKHINQEDNCYHCCKDLEKENKELTAQLEKCCKRNPMCCKKPKLSILTPVKPGPSEGSIDAKCCNCCKKLKKENEDLKSKIKKCCRIKPNSGTLIPIKKSRKG